MTIRIIKLITGEEIVGDCTGSVEEGKVKIKKPCMLQLMPSRSSDQTVMALIPYAVYTENHSIVVTSEKIIWLETPVKELYNQYNSAFGSGIQLAGVH